MMIYGADVDWNLPEKIQRAPEPFGQRNYCPYCRRREIKLPHKGTDEFLLAGTLTEKGSENYFQQKGVIDASSPNSGVEWDPVDIFNTYLPPFDLPNSEIHPDRLILGPATVYDELLFFGVRLETFVEDNTLDIPQENQHQIKHIVKELNERRQERRFIFQQFQRLGQV